MYESISDIIHIKGSVSALCDFAYIYKEKSASSALCNLGSLVLDDECMYIVISICFGLNFYKPVLYLVSFVPDYGNSSESETKENKNETGLKIFIPYKIISTTTNRQIICFIVHHKNHTCTKIIRSFVFFGK